MYWKNIGYLLKETNTVDELHRPKVSYTRKKVYCNIKSIGQSEFYQAQVTGLKPEIKVEIKCCNLDDTYTHFSYKNKKYKILRTYKKEDVTEITLTSLVVNNDWI